VDNDQQDNLEFKAIDEEIKEKIGNIDSVAVMQENQILTKSRAVFYIFSKLGGIWYPISFLKYLPKFITDKGYDVIAKYRYSLFGKSETCRLIQTEEKHKFI